MISNNGGLIDVAAGGATLSSDIGFNDGATVLVEGGQTLTLNHSGILGGTVNANGTIEVALFSTFNGATVKLGNNGQSGGQVVVDSGQKLNLKNSATITGGEYHFGGFSTQAQGGGSVLLSGGIADLDGTADPLTKQVTLTIVASNGTLDFVTMNGLTIVNNLDGTGGTLEVTGSLSDVRTALSNGTIYSPIGTSNTLTMTMDDGSGDTAFRVMSVDTSIAGSPAVQLTDTNGKIVNDGLIDVAAGNATLSTDIVFNDLGTVQVEGGQKLTLAYSGIRGGTVNANGTIEVAHNSTFHGATVNLGNDGQSGGQVLIDSGQKLNLEHDATITGGVFAIAVGRLQAVGDGSVVLLSGIGIGDLNGSNPDVTLTIESSGGTLGFVTMVGLTIDPVLDGTNGALQVTGSLSDVSAALYNGVNFTPADYNTNTTDTLNISVADIQGNIAFKTFDVTTASGAAPIVQLTETSGAIRNNGGLIDVAGKTALSSDVVFNGGATVQIEANKTLTLAHTGIWGGTISDYGTVKIAENSVIGNVTLNIDSGGDLVVVGGKTFTLSGTDTIANSGAIDVNGNLMVAGSVTLNGSGTMTLNNATIDNTDNASLTNNGNTIIGTGQIGSGSSNVLTLYNAASASIEASGGTLAFKTHSPIVNDGTLAAASGGTLQINAGNIQNAGNIDILSGGLLKIANPNGMLTLSNGGTLSLSGGTIDATQTETLKNVDNTISGYGIIGSGDGNLTLINAAGGIIDANGGTLTIDTGANTITNNGAMQASAGATLQISSDTNGTGAFGTQGGIVTFDHAVGNGLSVDFNVATADTLVLNDVAAFQGMLVSFGSADVIDLNNVTGLTSINYDGTTSTLQVLDSTSVVVVSLSLTGTYTTSNFMLSDLSDGEPNTWQIAYVNTGPAGIAGNPIRLALVDPSEGRAAGPITLTFTEVPSDWNLNEGTNVGDGTWIVQTSDPAALTVTTPSDFVGARVLHVAETWTNADGSTGSAFVDDNVEAYAPGSPIFALFGDDTLTGTGASDLFVFAQPIGNDTIYNFSAGSDKIDLIGFADIANFGDIQITDDGGGNAVITLGVGETITLNGVNAALLTADDFVFDQTPVTDNAGSMVVSDGAVLPLSGTINNSGTIALNSSGHQTELQIIGNGITLDGGGRLTLSDNSIIVGTNSSDVLTNVDNTVSGAGQIGAGDGKLTLVNGALGTIAATIAGSPLTLNTGATIVNEGILAAKGGNLRISDRVIGNGTLVILAGALELAALCAADVLFSTSANADGTLVIDHATDFTGKIYNFAGTGTQFFDAIDLKDIAYQGTSVVYSDHSGTDTGGTLTVYDMSNAAVDTVHFGSGEFQTGNFLLTDDGQGGLLIAESSTLTSNTLASSISSGVTTFKLTTGIDNVTLDNGNHQLIATDQTLNNGDKISGGTGTDVLNVDIGNGDHSFTFGDGNHSDIGLTGFENLNLTDTSATSDHSVTVSFDANFDNNGTLTVDGSALNQLSGSNLTVDAHLATQDSFVFIGSSHADTLIGGAQADTITGGGGGDTMTGGGDGDTFVFNATTDSHPGVGNFDTVTDFAANLDHLDFAAIAGLNSDNQAINVHTASSSPVSIAAHTIDILASAGETVIFANASDTAQAVDAIDMEIHLAGGSQVASNDFILHH
ncbi:MAG: hypothetical protein P8Y71_11555 [Pseudolabrys sp.]